MATRKHLMPTKLVGVIGLMGVVDFPSTSLAPNSQN